MPTDKPRIQVYLEPELYQKLVEWKEEREISKISEALNQLVAEYFGVSFQSPISNPQSLTKEEINEIIGNSLKNFGQLLDLRLDTFQAQIDSLKQIENYRGDTLNEIKGDLEELAYRLEKVEQITRPIEGLAEISHALNEGQDLPGDSLFDDHLPQDEAPGLEEVEISSADVEGDTEEAIEGDSLLPDEVPGNSLRFKNLPPSELGNNALARRLGVSGSTVLKNREKPNFEEWSKGHDPSGIAWRYDREKKLFIPIKGVADG